MFKLVVLCAFVAASVAEPEPQLLSALPAAAYPGYSGYYASAPALTTYSSGPVISSSPYFYNSPGYTHFIKKRSPQFPFGYIAPSYYYPEVRSPVVSSTLYNTHLATPIAGAVPLAATHLIKKRSASPEPEPEPKPILPNTYVSSSYVQSALPYNSYSSYYPGFYNYPSTYYPLAATTHFIKKRSAQFIPATSYLAQAGTYAAGAPLYSTQYAAAGAPIISPYLASPYYPYSTYIKK